MMILSLEHPIRWLIYTHILAATIAVLVLGIPLLTKKGSKLHMRAGWIFSSCMIFVGLSTFVITLWRISFDSGKTQTSENLAIFLAYVSCLTLAAIYYGISALKAKERLKSSFSIAHIGPPVISIVFGLIVQIIGFKFSNVLLILFPWLGHANSLMQIRYWVKEPKRQKHWYYAHLNGMYSAAIATLTVFVAISLSRLWPGPVTTSPWIWFIPVIVMAPFLKRMNLSEFAIDKQQS